MAAEALNKAAQKLGISCKVETNGSDGPQNVLTADEIAACDGIIVAADKNVETARFDGKPVLFAHVDDGIHKPEQLLQSVLDGKVPVFHSTVRESDKNLLEQNRGGSAKDSLGHTPVQAPDVWHLPHDPLCCGRRHHDCHCLPAG